jgi:hypothetical protein
MIHITIQTRTTESAERLALHLMKHGLLLYPTLDTDHEELTLMDGVLRRDKQLLLQGMTKALLYRDVEREAMEQLKEQLVRIHATPITHMDAEAQRTLLEQTVKV